MSDELDETPEGEDAEFELNLGDMDNEELVRFEALLVGEYDDKRGSTEELSAEDVDELQAILDVLDGVRAEMDQRERLAELDAKASKSKGAEFAAKIAARQAAAEELSDEGADEAEEEAEEVEEEAAAEEVVADETPKVTISPKGLKSDSKAPAKELVSAITASADVPGFSAGQTIPDLSGVARALMAKRPAVRGTDKGFDGSRFLVASIAGDYSEERTLSMDLDSNMAKIEAVTSVEALSASGGLCAPITPYYTLNVLGDACRPVRDSLPSFKAERGGIRFLPAPEIADLAGSTRRTTAVQDAAGYTNQDPAGTTAPKPCLHVTCETEQTCVIGAVSRCLTFGNMGARTYPEQVEAWTKLGLAEFARYTEVELIDAIEAGSTALTQATQIYGAVFNLLEQVSRLVTSFRGRYRLCSSQQLRVIFPWWVKEIFRSDLAAQAPGDGLARYAVPDSQIMDWFSVRGVSVTWRQDEPTGADALGTIFTQPVSAGALFNYPGSVEWAIFPEGNWIYLDGGTLDLGLVRDSTLNSTNDYQIFFEEFNGLCNLHGRSLWVTSDIVANGSYAPAAAALRSY